MKIFYDSDNNIVGTVEGFSDNESIDMPGLKSENITLGHPLEKWARDLENPNKKEINTSDYRFDGEKFTKKSDKELKEREDLAKKAQIEAKKRLERKEYLKDKLRDKNVSSNDKIDMLIEYLFDL